MSWVHPLMTRWHSVLKLSPGEQTDCGCWWAYIQLAIRWATNVWWSWKLTFTLRLAGTLVCGIVCYGDSVVTHFKGGPTFCGLTWHWWWWWRDKDKDCVNVRIYYIVFADNVVSIPPTHSESHWLPLKWLHDQWFIVLFSPLLTGKEDPADVPLGNKDGGWFITL